MNGGCRDRAVALIAQEVDVRHIEQPGILRPVRRVASRATLALDRRVLVDKRPALICMALGADLIGIVPRPDVVPLKCAVHIVAIGALNQALVHFVVEGHVELRVLLGVALIAEHGLRSLEQMLALSAGHGARRSAAEQSRDMELRLHVCAVNAVATGAANTGLGVRRALKVRMGAGMATEIGSVV